MVKLDYDWENGALLPDHTKRKHDIIRDYFYQYLLTRCINPNTRGLHIAVVDGFSGGGRYKCGSPGSPIIILEVLQQAVDQINIERAQINMPACTIKCDLILNDFDRDAIEQLKEHCTPILAKIKAEKPNLIVNARFYNQKFEDIKPEIVKYISENRIKSAFFLLDQCGTANVSFDTVYELINLVPHAELILNFNINSMKSFASPDVNKNKVTLPNFDLAAKIDNLLKAEEKEIYSKDQWLGYAEKVIYEAFCKMAKYVAPFSIKRPDGYHYWLVHFAQQFAARRVYNDVLYDNHNHHAHYGKSGLDMLGYDPSLEGALHSFTMLDRDRSIEQQHVDAPRYVTDYGGAIDVQSFLEHNYQHTVSHSEDIPRVWIESDDLEVVTDKGNPRRSVNTIKGEDIIRLKKQPAFFPGFGISRKPKKS